MNKRKTILLSILGALLIAVLAVGVSYAFWKVTKVQPGEANQLSTTCLNLTLESLSDNISLQAQFPIIDEEGRKLEGYTFKVTNTCNTYVTYDINLESMIDSTVSESERLNLNYLDAILDNGKIKELGSYETTDSALKTEEGTAYDTRKLKTDTIKPGTTTTPTIKEYTLRVWLDEDVTGTDAMNKTWIGKISIKGWPVKIYADASGAEQPELNNGMIPVTYDTATSKWVKADTTEKWYDYDAQWWANAVTVSASSRAAYTSAVANTPIEMNDIETMWVWVPRYEYNSELLKTPANYGGTAESPGTKTQPKGIEINFISKDTVSASSSNFTIHDAFKWGDEEASKEQLAGIWVAKFEMSPTDATCKSSTSTANCNKLQAINIKPNVSSWRYAQMGTMWNSIHQYMNGTNNQYGLTNTDAHLMKNMEWGAVAYLSQSKYGKYGNSSYTGANKEVAINNCNRYITGIGGDTVSADTSSTTCTTNTYETAKGQAASTTGNIYGIYDMSGGATEYVMGVMKANGSNEPAVGYSTSKNSGWSGKIYGGGKWTTYTSTTGYGRLGDDPSTTDVVEGIGARYYDLYEYGTNAKDYTRGHLGDATKEVIASDSASTVTGWYSDAAGFVYSANLFFVRGGEIYDLGTNAGVFNFRVGSAAADSAGGGRPVLVPLS